MLELDAEEGQTIEAIRQVPREHQAEVHRVTRAHCARLTENDDD